MLREPLFQPRQLRRDRFLRGIALDLALASESGITFGDGCGHRLRILTGVLRKD